MFGQLERLTEMNAALIATAILERLGMLEDGIHFHGASTVELPV